MRISNTNKDLMGNREVVNGGSFTKYCNLSNLIKPKAGRNKNNISNIHCRSMEEIIVNPGLASHSSISKQNMKANIHHSSLFNDKENCINQGQPTKSKSLNKFIALFQNSNIMNAKNERAQVKNQKNHNLKRKNYNGFCYDLKIAANPITINKKLVHKKDKQNIYYQPTSNTQTINITGQQQGINSHRQFNNSNNNNNKSSIIVKKQNSNEIFNRSIQGQEMLLIKMKQVIQEQKKRQGKLQQRVKLLQQKNSQLSNKLKDKDNQISTFSQKQAQYEVRIKQTQKKMNQYQQKIRILVSKEQKNNLKECKQHNLVIKSLKKVINEQINKVIELQRFRMQNQYLRQKIQNYQMGVCTQKSESNIQCSFMDQNYSQKEQLQSQNSQKKQYYRQETFKKLRPQKNQYLQSLKHQSSQKHFRSFFKIQESPSDGSSHHNLFRPMDNKKEYEIFNDRIKMGSSKDATDMIKMRQAESSFSQQAIQQVTEQNQENQPTQYHISQKSKTSTQKFTDFTQEQDSILQQVDQYLTKWRNKS